MKRQLSCVVLDDCALDRIAVESEIGKYPDLCLIGSFNNCLEAVGFFKLTQPDILFIDIDMPEINGLDFIKTITNSNTINVIISSYPEYALEGFKLKVFDFILKPLENDRFENCIKRVFDFIELKQKADAYDVLFEQEQILFKEGLITVKLRVHDIIYLEAYGDYTKIVTHNKVHLTLTPLSKFLETLPSNAFIRIHRSYVVAYKKVESFNLKHIFIAEMKLPVGKTYHKEIKERFKFFLNLN